MSVFEDVFIQLDDLEASSYYKISKERLEVIEKLESLEDNDVKEKVIQDHLFDNLWLLDPSWERATLTDTEHMNITIRKALGASRESLPEELRDRRPDIQYITTGGKHVLIELKRPSKRLDTSKLMIQIRRYHHAVKKILKEQGEEDRPFEIVCVLGQPLTDWQKYDNKSESTKELKAYNARIVFYNNLIRNARKAYSSYLEKRVEARRVYDLIMSIEEKDMKHYFPNVH